MTHYTGDPKRTLPSVPPDLNSSRQRDLGNSDGYIVSKDLVAAVNVALTLGQPLLLTGAPGTGKTRLAYSAARELGFGEPLRFNAKSTSEARDLFYSFDALRQFRDSQRGLRGAIGDYITLNALGLAIVRANEPGAFSDLGLDCGSNTSAQRSIVLIDEIDKAPRDFPNDILNEIEGMEFRIIEANKVLKAKREMAPIVFITSNAEKGLPDAFLRRCVYFDIPFPDRDHLRRIVSSRIKMFRNGEALVEDALEVFEELHQPGGGLRKPPGTAELLNWLIVLGERKLQPADRLSSHPEVLRDSLASLVKTREDRLAAIDIIGAKLNTAAMV
jgi:MoxR-like ATPase